MHLSELALSSPADNDNLCDCGARWFLQKTKETGRKATDASPRWSCTVRLIVDKLFCINTESAERARAAAERNNRNVQLQLTYTQISCFYNGNSCDSVIYAVGLCKFLINKVYNLQYSRILRVNLYRLSTAYRTFMHMVHAWVRVCVCDFAQEFLRSRA